MGHHPVERGTLPREALAPLLVRAWLATAVVDFLFASALSRFGYGSTVTRLWQGVAATVLGQGAYDGGLKTALVGVVMHIGVALAWSAVFVAIVAIWPRLRQALDTTGGVLGVAALYGPMVWMAMSFVVVPSLTGRPPRVTIRWWIQVVGHMLFVALPMATAVARGLRTRVANTDAREAAVVA